MSAATVTERRRRSELVRRLRQSGGRGRKLRGLATGFTDFDHKTGGLRGGDLVVIAGRGAAGRGGDR